MLRSKTLGWLLILLCSAPALGAEEPLGVVVSIEPHRWLVEQIGGDSVAVEVLVSPGESPTTFQPTDAQVTHLMRSRLYFRIGVPFESGLWFDAVEAMGRFLMVDLRQGIELTGGDPHIWLSPTLLADQAATVAEALSVVDPQRRALYESKLAALRRRLTALDEEIRGSLEPYAGRAFLVFHPSWGYFASRYGLRQLAVEVEGRGPDDAELTRLRDQVRDERLTTLFVQPQIHGQGARTVARSLGLEVEILDPLLADVEANLLQVTRRLLASFR